MNPPQPPLGIIRKFNRPIEVVKVLFAWAVLIAIIYWCRPSPLQFYIGSLSFAVGEAIRVWAAGHLRRGKELTLDGPYAYVRDPLYLGRLFWVLGLSFFSGQPGVGAALIAIFIWFYCTKKIPKEMRNLEKTFGEPYRAYCSQVRSLVPRLTPYPDRRGIFWHWSTFIENKEHYAVCIILLIVAVFGVKTF